MGWLFKRQAPENWAAYSRETNGSLPYFFAARTSFYLQEYGLSDERIKT